MDESTDYVFTVQDEAEHNPHQTGKIEIIAGGVKVEMLIDSGATCNIIDKDTWTHLKECKIICKTEKVDKELFPMYAKLTHPNQELSSGMTL